MFFKREEQKEEYEEDDIETLVMRLDSSVYDEDRNEALRNIYQQSKIDILGTGTYALDAVIRSINSLEEIDLPLDILFNIFNSNHFNEFCDLLIKNPQNIHILIDCSEKNPLLIYKLLIILIKNNKVKESLLNVQNIAYYCIDMLRINKYEILAELSYDDNFKKQVLYAGVFECLLSKMDDKPQTWIFDTLIILIKEDHFNQNYFVQADVGIVFRYFELYKDKTFELLNCLVDNTNINMKYVKDVLNNYIDLKKGYDHGNWLFLYNMIFDSPKHIGIFLDSFDNIDKIVRSVSSTNLFLRNSALLLISELLLYKKFSTSSKNLNLLNVCILRGYEFTCKEDIKGTKNFEHIIYTNQVHDGTDQPRIDTSLNTEDSKTDNDPTCFNNIDINESGNSDVVKEPSIHVNLKNVFENINFDSLIFILFDLNRDMISEKISIVVETANDCTSEEASRLLCILICEIFEIKLNMSPFYICKSLKHLRKIINDINIESEFYLIDDCIELMNSTINELILKLGVRCDPSSIEK